MYTLKFDDSPNLWRVAKTEKCFWCCQENKIIANDDLLESCNLLNDFPTVTQICSVCDENVYIACHDLGEIVAEITVMGDAIGVKREGRFKVHYAQRMTGSTRSRWFRLLEKCKQIEPSLWRNRYYWLADDIVTNYC